MPASDMEKAKAFLQGIASGNADLATRYVDAGRYVEHDPIAADGVAGLRSRVDGLPKDGANLRIVRVLQDGAFVVVQAEGEVLGRNVRFDVFRFDAGLIVEHWSFAANGAPPNKSGHTQADGPTEPRPNEDTEANKAIVRDYYETVHLAGSHDQARRWFSSDTMIRHEPGVADGVAEFLRDLEVLTRDRTIDEIGILVAQGDFVFLAARGTHRSEPCVYVDLYRVEAGRIVEHWGFPEAVPTPEERKNHNGVL